MENVKRLQAVLNSKNIDLALFLNKSDEKKDKSIFYFSDVEYSFSCLLIHKTKEPILIAGLEFEDAKKYSCIKKVINLDGKKKISDIIKEYGVIKRIGVNGEFFTINEKKAFKKSLKSEFIDITPEINELKQLKNNDEIRKIRKACQLADQIFSEFLKNFDRFKTEKEAALFLEDLARKKADGPSFEAIVASGKNGAQPHHKPSDNKINDGFCVIDFGIKYQGYCSDMTRTIYYGEPSDEEIKTYSEVLEVQKACITKAREGVKLNDLNEYAKDCLGKEFIHSLGHGLGLSVHEAPNFSKKEKLKTGMIITIEPGVYKKNNYGIRIEDDILITKNKPEILSKTTKNLIVIK